MKLECIRSNSRKVIASGSVIGFSELPEISFELKEEDKFKFTLKMIFLEDENTEMGIRSEVKDESITIKCVNFKNPIGSGFREAVDLATVAGKKISFRFVAYNMAQMPVMHYTFYEE